MSMSRILRWLCLAVLVMALLPGAALGLSIHVVASTPSPEPAITNTPSPSPTSAPTPTQAPEMDLIVEETAESQIPAQSVTPVAMESATPTPYMTPTQVPTPSPTPTVTPTVTPLIVSLNVSGKETVVPFAEPWSQETLPPLEALDETPTLPIDFSPGKMPQTDGYLSEYEYEDPTIHVKITGGREMDTTYWVAEIRIQDPSQLRTASTDGFDSQMTMPGLKLARRVNAVVAADGDYFFYTGRGFIRRQGQTYLNRTTGGRDILLVDEDGDFHIVRKADNVTRSDMYSDKIDGKNVINAFFFGPVLVEHGELGTNFHYIDMAADYTSQRMAICQVGPLHYMLICCESPKRGSRGLTLREWAEFVRSKGVDTAYNLDGGDSTMLYFQQRKINDVDNPNERQLADIIYFASAWDPEK
ncbi:MAG: phosphodiester glycosidase family protein [Clostridia bacterium]|nr:phosphodiester glycosidase family protein [Clostridia bacterium]